MFRAVLAKASLEPCGLASNPQCRIAICNARFCMPRQSACLPHTGHCSEIQKQSKKCELLVYFDIRLNGIFNPENWLKIPKTSCWQPNSEPESRWNTVWQAFFKVFGYFLTENNALNPIRNCASSSHSLLCISGCIHAGKAMQAGAGLLTRIDPRSGHRARPDAPVNGFGASHAGLHPRAFASHLPWLGMSPPRRATGGW